MPLIHHPVLRRELEVSEDAAEIFTTVPRKPWVRGPLPKRNKPTAAIPVPVGDAPTPSEED